MSVYALLFLTACNPAPSDTGEDPDPFGPDEIPNTLVFVDECSTVTDSTGAEHPTSGATSYFLGNYAYPNDTDMEGTERQILFPNDTWRENEEELSSDAYCVIQWSIFGVKGDPINCATCDYSLTVDAYIDEAASTCPRGLSDTYGAQFSDVYNVNISSGKAILTWADDGVRFGEGAASDDELSWASSYACTWY